MKKLIEYTKILRSKNAGPLFITFDLIFHEKEQMQYIYDRLTKEMVASAYDIEKDVNIPSLSDLTAAAIRALDGSEEGFFLMVEGSKIDGGGHQNFDLGMAGDFLAFDDACRVAVEYAKTRKDTMVIMAPDHDTGGMVLPENMEEVIATLQQGKSSTDIKWESLQHTARNGGLFIYAPEGVAYPEGISGNDIGTMKAWEENVIDNTDVPKYIAKVMGLDLEGTSAKLFVDVTDKGTYDEETKLFKFTDSKYTARADASYAYYGDECFDLDGQICVFVKNHFYVPQLLIDVMDGKATTQPSAVGPTLYSTLSVTMPGVDVKDWDASLKVKNLLPTKEFNGSITFTSPEPFAAMEPIPVKALAGDEERIITFKCPEFDISKSGLRFKYKITAEDGTESEYSSKFVPAMYATYTDTPIVVDGVIDDEQWKNSLVIKCDTMDSLVDIEDWKGERDMSSEFSILWDEENLYFYAITCDETFYTNNTMIPLRNLDSITIGLYEDTDNAFARGENCSSLYEHLEFAIIDGQPDARRDRVQKFISAPGNSKSFVIPQDENFELKTRRDGDYAIYEMRISWKNLYGYEYSPLEDDIMAFAFVATDNDGAGKRGYMAYGSGLGGSRVVSKFSKMIMLDPHGKKAEIPEKVTVLYNGEEVVGDVEPINYNGRPMIPLRAFAEKAGITVEWNDEIKTAILTKGETKVEVPTSINNTILKAGLDFFVVRVNGEDRIIDASTILESGRTLVPLRAITEGFGFKAHFDGPTQTVTITD